MSLLLATARRVEDISGRSLVSLLFLSIVALILVVGLPALQFVETFSVPPTQSETVHSSFDEQFRESDITLVLSSFDPDSKVLSANVRMDIYDRQFGDLSGGNEFVGFALGSQDFSDYYRVLERDDDLKYRTDLSFTLDGDPTRYPFDRYSGPIEIGAIPPDGYTYVDDGHVHSPRLLPAEIKVRRLFPGYNVRYDDSGPGVNGFNITLTRTGWDQALFGVAAVLYLGFIAILLVASFTGFGVDHPVAVVIGIAGLGLSLPGLRDLIVPDDIQVRTIVDTYLVLPFMIGAVAVFIVLGIRNIARESGND